MKSPTAGKERSLISTAIIFAFFLFAFLLPASLAFGQSFFGSLVPCGSPGLLPCTISCIPLLAQNVINFLIAIAVFIAVLLFVYAGFLYITSTGDTEKISKAHGVFWNVFIGLIIVLVSWIVVDTIMKYFYDDQKFGPWNRIDTIQCTPTDVSGFRPDINPEMGPGRLQPKDEPLPDANYCYREFVLNVSQDSWPLNCYTTLADCNAARTPEDTACLPNPAVGGVGI